MGNVHTENMTRKDHYDKIDKLSEDLFEAIKESKEHFCGVFCMMPTEECSDGIHSSLKGSGSLYGQAECAELLYEAIEQRIEKKLAKKLIEELQGFVDANPDSE